MNGVEKAKALIASEREHKTGFLDLGNLELTELPRELFDLTHLRRLNLGTWYLDEHGEFRESANHVGDTVNALTKLPREICALKNLLALSLRLPA